MSSVTSATGNEDKHFSGLFRGQEGGVGQEGDVRHNDFSWYIYNYTYVRIMGQEDGKTKLRIKEQDGQRRN